jgi:hypothetical protein
MGYEAMSAAELRSAAEQRYADSRQRLMGLMDARQRLVQETQAKYEAQMQQQEQELAAEQAEGSKNWLNAAGTGASMGMAGGGWGALIGGGVGAALGVAQSAQQYSKEGHGRWGSIGQALIHPAGEKFELTKDVPLQAIPGLVGGLAGAATATPAKPEGGVDAADPYWNTVANEDALNRKLVNARGGVAPAAGSLFGSTGNDMSAAFEKKPKV